MSTAADAKKLKTIDATIAEKQKKIEQLRMKCATIFVKMKTLLSHGKEDEVENLKIDLTFIKEDVQELKYDIHELDMEKQHFQEKIESSRKGKDKDKKKLSAQNKEMADIEKRVEALLRSSEKSADVQEQMERIKLEDMEMDSFRQSLRQSNPGKRRELVNLYRELCNELGIPVDENWLKTAF